MLNVVSTELEEIDTHESFQSSLYNRLSAVCSAGQGEKRSACQCLSGPDRALLWFPLKKNKMKMKTPRIY